jgi:transcriptional regulator MraZ
LAFRGRYEHSLDSKDRLTVPARFRSALADGVVLSKGLDPCVDVFSVEGFDQFSERFLAGHSPLSTRGRQIRRRFHGSAFDEKVDSAGRVRLARPLIEHAGLEGACVVVGTLDHLEIWNAETYVRHEAELDAAAVEIAEGLAEAG